MVEDLIAAWHDAVNRRDLEQARRLVADPVDVSGPRGSAAISAAEFAEWITRSGVTLTPVDWHPAGPGTMVVEQDARWDSGADAPVRVVTLFRVRDGLVAGAHRFDSLDAALVASAQAG